MKRAIEAQAPTFESQTALEQERSAHTAFAAERSRKVFGRDAERQQIREYLANDDSLPMVIHGPSGSGKSSLLAAASEENPGIRRFIGATPQSSSGLGLLRSLCEEMAEHNGQDFRSKGTYQELADMFQRLL